MSRGVCARPGVIRPGVCPAAAEKLQKIRRVLKAPKRNKLRCFFFFLKYKDKGWAMWGRKMKV